MIDGSLKSLAWIYEIQVTSTQYKERPQRPHQCCGMLFHGRLELGAYSEYDEQNLSTFYASSINIY